MSDIQLATGVAILVSGYSQLPCGLSCYHWTVVGRLAWFSSLTHLSCLTLLRNYLHNRPAERHWRMLFMFVLIIMLVTAMAPTITWFTLPEFPPKKDHAICHFSRIPIKTFFESISAVPTISLVLLISLGFAIRVVKLHKTSSISFVGRSRQKLSKTIRRFLWIIYIWKEASTSLPRRTIGRILYFPGLASFLMLRLLLDHWSSMFFEVSRMTLNFKDEISIIF